MMNLAILVSVGFSFPLFITSPTPELFHVPNTVARVRVFVEQRLARQPCHAHCFLRRHKRAERIL